jgi:chromosome segregation ATPase
MTREQISALLPEGTDNAVVTSLLDALHAEIKPYKDAAKQSADELAAKIAEMGEISKKAATAEEKTRAFEELQAKYNADIKAANDRAAEIEFDSLLDGALREKGAKNLKAARALLDMDTLRASKNQKEDVYAAVTAIASAEDSAFIFDAQATGKTSIGKASGKSTQPADGVESAFMRLTPGIEY